MDGWQDSHPYFMSGQWDKAENGGSYCKQNITGWGDHHVGPFANVHKKAAGEL